MMIYSVLKKSILTSTLFVAFSMLVNAQVYTPSGTTLPLSATNHDMTIGANYNLHPNPDVFYNLGIHAGTVTYGNRSALFAKSYANGTTGQADGLARASLATSADWFANGALYGVNGIADSVNILNNTVAANTSTCSGGIFSSIINDPISSPTVGTYNITGTSTSLQGNISTYPDQGVVAALYANDLIQGSGTWAGYFDGRGYYSNNVGIGTTNPLSMLSVNGDGDSKWSGYFSTASTTTGNKAVMGEAAQPTGFADHVYAMHGRIQSGSGYAYGVRGDSYNTNPSSQGRSYGVFAVGGNATDGANYGVYSRLLGSNSGVAVLGHDEVSFSGAFNGLLPDASKTWAGYFVGDMFVHNKVGIGTDNFTSPGTPSGIDYRLFVCGGVRAKELLIDNTSWCDYVFEKDYDLLDLVSVESHIEENGHLHNTPSAKAIEEQGGVELGEMTRIQQEKIEEIFLHLIQMNKDLETLKAENVDLKRQLKNR